MESGRWLLRKRKNVWWWWRPRQPRRPGFLLVVVLPVRFHAASSCITVQYFLPHNYYRTSHLKASTITRRRERRSASNADFCGAAAVFHARI